MEYEPTIGIETHAQLLTVSKMFCRCAVPPPPGQDAVVPSLGPGHADAGRAAPNSYVCPVCLGMPGSLPVINRRAVEYVILTGLALNCQIAEFSKFDRKNYHYPDLVKGYQISQFHLPLCRDGWLEVNLNAHTRRFGISDIHLEEDTGKLVHLEGQSLIDFNRSGVPLMEIVTAPDFASVEAVREYVLELRRILRYLGVNSGNMEEGAMRFEANISLHPAGTTVLGTRVEVKNLNSFKALLRALEYEIGRQRQVLEQGETIQRETRGWHETQAVTYVQRSKEFADDYRYFPEPDLPPLEISRECVEEIRARMPELPRARRLRFSAEYQLSPYDADLLTEDRAIADYFEAGMSAASPKDIEPKTVANWITGELFYLLHDANVEITSSGASPQQLIELLTMLRENMINITTAKQVLKIMFDTGMTAAQIVEEQRLAVIADRDRLASIVDQVISANPAAVTQYKRGKETVLRFLIGQVMKATRGKAEPQLAADLLRQKLGGN
jgi:aspartyl-tRNA(Asn)/glutamyl-tRNA(Gln) amidotransferase subunit B